MPESQKKADADLNRLVKVVRVLAPLGIGRWVIPSKGLPEELEAANRALALRTPNVVTLCDAWLCWDTWISQMEGCTLPPDIPLAVLSASKWDVGIGEIPPEDAKVALSVHTECQAEIALPSSRAPSANTAIYRESAAAAAACRLPSSRRMPATGRIVQ